MKNSPPKNLSQQRGSAGEALAENYLSAQGLVPVARNFRSTYGEIDLIMRQGATWVFIEVKQRSSTAFGSPAECVTASKQKKIALAAAAFFQQQHISGQAAMRFDVVAIVAHTGQTPEITWIPHAFNGH